MTGPEQWLLLARQNHQHGNLAAAESLYRRVLDVHPEHADARMLLGVVKARTGALEDAVDLLEGAMPGASDPIACRASLAGVLRDLVRRHEGLLPASRASQQRQETVQEIFDERSSERVSDLELPPLPFTPDQLLLGVAYIDDETHSRVDEPLGFAPKNYVSIRDLHRLALAIARPDLPGVPDLGLTPAHRKHLLASMTDNPAESSNPVYADMDNGLRYKTMIGGMLEELPITRLRYVGKAGRAYGFHLDNAYIEDTKTKRAMVVTAVAYANANGVLNDNAYEYDGITRPFLRNLGQVLARAVLVEGEGT